MNKRAGSIDRITDPAASGCADAPSSSPNAVGEVSNRATDIGFGFTIGGDKPVRFARPSPTFEIMSGNFAGFAGGSRRARSEF
jgi:hypothetical protein